MTTHSTRETELPKMKRPEMPMHFKDRKALKLYNRAFGKRMKYLYLDCGDIHVVFEYKDNADYYLEVRKTTPHMVLYFDDQKLFEDEAAFRGYVI